MSAHDHDDELPPDPPVEAPIEIPPDPPTKTLADARHAPPPHFPPDPLPPIFTGGSVNLIGGAPYVGKTLLVAWLVRQFLEGTVLGYPVPAGAISEHVYIAGTGSWQKTHHKVFAGLAVRPYAIRDDLALDPGRGRRRQDRLAAFEEALAHVAPKPHAIVWVDPLTCFFSGSLLDPEVCHHSTEVVARLALKYQITLVGTTLAAKSKPNPQERYQSLVNRIASSAALYACMDTTLYLATPEECDRLVHTLGVYPRQARQQTYDLIQHPETGHFAYATSEQGETALHKAIPEAPASIHVSELQSLLCQPDASDSLSRPTLYRHLRLLTERGIIRQVERGRYQRRKLS